MTSQPLTDEQIDALRTEAGQHGDLAQRILCDIALRGEDDNIDHRGVWSADEYADIERMADPAVRWALRLTSTEARAECARVIAHAAAQAE